MNESPLHPGLGRTEPRARARHVLIAVALGALPLLLLGVALAGPSALRRPRDLTLIQQILAKSAHAGDCDQCHTMHGDGQPTVYPNALVGPDDNGLCMRCHTTAWVGGSFATDELYRGTGHGANTSMIWPGPVPPPRIEMDAATKCLNCHDPHGWTDAQGTIPALGLQREEKLCLACHDGSPAATDVLSDLRKPYRHPTLDFNGRHTGAAEEQPSDFGAIPLNKRHAECVDCHNPHVARADRGSHGSGGDASKLTLGVSRVSVANGAPGTRPLYAFVPASDTLTAPNMEYQLCFKCHSSWTTQPAGQTDLAVALNPANPSYHPVEDAGRNPSIPVTAFAPGWSAGSLTRCGDCHGSDFGSTEGPHGSANEHLLRRPYPMQPASRIMDMEESCFSCHAFDVYGNSHSPASVRSASRFNAPGATGGGHAEHVGDQAVPCYACHVTHGSSTLPFLLSTQRVPGLTSFTTTPLGGTCTSSCHDRRSYSANYAR